MDRIVYGNTISEWAIALAVAAATLITLWLMERFVLARLSAFARRTETDLDDLLAELLTRTKFVLLVFVAVFIASLTLTLPPELATGLRRAAQIALVLQGGIWANAAVSLYSDRYAARAREVDAAAVTTVTALAFVGRIIVWVIVVLLGLDNLGVEITALVAGVGIGGIAVALAAQSILGDIFAALAIILDKPFVTGDFIVVGDYQGSVEYVGLKTTRIHSLSGEQLVLSNSDLLGSRIRNYGRLAERRMSFTIGVTYDTPRDKLETLPEVLREVVEAREGTRFDRAHLTGFGEFSIDFQTVYFVTLPAYAAALDIQQEINLDLHRRLEEAEIEFAYPTRVVFTKPLDDTAAGSA